MPPKASITMTDGTKIELDGSLEELQSLTEHLHSRSSGNSPPPARGAQRVERTPPPADEADTSSDEEPDIARIAGLIKECDEAELIDAKVLGRRDVLNRLLMCFWVVHKYVNSMMGLTSGDIERITDQLGVKVAVSNASTMLGEKARPYVTGDTVRKQGAPVRYRLNRRGVQAFEDVLKA